VGLRGSRIVAAVIIAGLAVAPGWAKTNYHSGIWNILRKAHFCFAENGDSRASPAGVISAGGKNYDIWRYSWEETPQSKAGSTEHAAYRILVLERTKTVLSFLGNYKVDGVPFRIRERTIKFDYGRPKPGEAPKGDDEIAFGENGPPSSAVIDGEIRDFDAVPYPLIDCQ